MLTIKPNSLSPDDECFVENEIQNGFAYRSKISGEKELRNIYTIIAGLRRKYDELSEEKMQGYYSALIEMELEEIRRTLQQFSPEADHGRGLVIY